LVPPSNGRTDLVPSSNVITDQLTESNSRHLVSVLVDITEENNLQKHLIQSERLGALGRLASGIAHDFNNNLAIILGRTEFLLMNLGKIEKIEEGLQIMQKAALDGAEIVRRIQEFTGNKKKKEFIQLDVNELVKDVIRMTEPRWKDQSQRDGIEFDILAYFDSQQNIAGSDSDLREVLTNMIFNALDAMPEGGTISIKTYDENSNVNISISDTGFGISPKVIGNIFEPFFTTKDIGHSGMGLSVVYGIVKGHNGNIDVKSIPDKGTTFIITIPVSEGIIKAETESINSANPININVLVIDDEESIRDILKNVLVQFGNNVTDVSNGRSGIEVFQSGKFDVVITDLGMPEVSGWEVARQVKTIDPKIKVILLTGWDIELDEKGLKEKNVDFVINKPFRISQITKSIWECVGSGNN
ncbi:MAG: ATP-binding protein, partial [Candidatus Poribacteria bacterium]